MVVTILLKLWDTSRRSLVLTWNLSAGLVSDGWELDRSSTLLVARGRSTIGGVLAFSRYGGGSGTILLCLSLVLLFLLASLPLLSDLLEFYDTCMLVC
jgi:hypothetical protein